MQGDSKPHTKPEISGRSQTRAAQELTIEACRLSGRCPTIISGLLFLRRLHKKTVRGIVFPQSTYKPFWKHVRKPTLRKESSGQSIFGFHAQKLKTRFPKLRCFASKTPGSYHLVDQLQRRQRSITAPMLVVPSGLLQVI